MSEAMENTDESIVTDESQENVTAESSTVEEQQQEKPAEDWREKRFKTEVHKRKRAEAKIEQLKKQLDDQQEPEIPDFPDDELRDEKPEEYRQKIKERDEAIAKRASWDATRNITQSQIDGYQSEIQASSEEANQEIARDYVDNAIKAGISQEKVQANEAALVAANVDPELARHLYSDPSGPQVVDYLASKPETLTLVAAMQPMQAAIYIETQVKSAAVQSKPTTTQAPDPLDTTSGSGSPPQDEFDKLAEGYSFE